MSGFMSLRRSRNALYINEALQNLTIFYRVVAIEVNDILQILAEAVEI
jgi:hypothetical protein